MNETFRRRLIGLAVLLVVVFILSLLLPKGTGQPGSDGLPTTTVALDGSSPTIASGSLPRPISTPAAESAIEEPSQVPSPAPEHTPPSALPPVSHAPAAKSAKLGVPAAISPEMPKPTPPEVIKPTPPPAPVVKDVKPVPAKPTVPPPVAVLPKPTVTPTPPPLTSPPPTTKPAAVASPPSAVQKPPAGTLWYVQIGSFADAGNAQTTLSLIQNIGYRGESSKIVNGSGATLYRVRLGPFPTEPVARQAFDKVSKQGYPQARVLSETSAR